MITIKIFLKKYLLIHINKKMKIKKIKIKIKIKF